MSIRIILMAINEYIGKWDIIGDNLWIVIGFLFGVGWEAI
jgi:hypothetical protein